MGARLILASGSTVRQTLLKNAGLVFEAIPASVNEREVEEALPMTDRHPSLIARHLAIAKAKDVAAGHPDAFVVGCDQTMSLDGRIFHKASSIDEARSTLETLRSRTHFLHSAVCLVRNGAVIWDEMVQAQMHVRSFSDDFLAGYLDRNGQGVLSSVGCYQLEGEGIQLFEAIEGDYFAILGLPLLPLLAVLRQYGVNHA